MRSVPSAQSSNYVKLTSTPGRPSTSTKQTTFNLQWKTAKHTKLTSTASAKSDTLTEETSSIAQPATADYAVYGSTGNDSSGTTEYSGQEGLAISEESSSGTYLLVLLVVLSRLGFVSPEVTLCG